MAGNNKFEFYLIRFKFNFPAIGLKIFLAGFLDKFAFKFFLKFLCCGNFLLVDHSLENTMINNLCCIFFLQTVRALGKMRFNKSEVAALALGQPSHKFEKEGVLFVREKQEGFFRRTESKILRISNHFILY